MSGKSAERIAQYRASVRLEGIELSEEDLALIAELEERGLSPEQQIAELVSRLSAKGGKEGA
jgi:hypothetical protein